MNRALRELASIIKKQNIASLALPKLATGVGGLTWDEVEPLIDQHLADAGIPVIIYETYEKGNKADERINPL